MVIVLNTLLISWFKINNVILVCSKIIIVELNYSKDDVNTFWVKFISKFHLCAQIFKIWSHETQHYATQYKEIR